MTKKALAFNDFSFDLVVRVDARNCGQLVIRLLAVLATLVVIASKAVVCLKAVAG